MRIPALAPAVLCWIFSAGCGDDPPPPPPKAAPKAAAPVDTGEPVVAPRNSLPKIRGIVLGPAEATTDTDLTVEVTAVDPDTDDHLDVDVVWVINDTPQVDQTGDRLSRHLIHKGDVVKVKVTVSDGTDQAEQLSAPKTIGNAPPLFLTDVKAVSKIDGLKLEVTDPDGDDISFFLSGGPRGMTIDRMSGVLSYKGHEDEPGGDYKPVVAAKDGDGGSAVWSFEVSVSPGSAAVQRANEAADGADGEAG